MTRSIIYDTETVNAVPSHGRPRIKGVEYCEGWTDYIGMGISVVAAYDYATSRYRVFCADNAGYFRRLVERADIIIGFNSHKFDDNLLAAHGVDIPIEKSYDLIVELWMAAGLSLEYAHDTHSGFSLDDCTRANFGITKKQGGGSLAPAQWQKDEIGAVIDYCLHDVFMVKLLIDRIIETGELINPINPKEQLKVRKPW